MNLLQLLINLTLFIILIFFIFYLPGYLIIKKAAERLEDQEILTFSFCIGLVVFLIEGVFFGLINIRFLTLPVILLTGLLTILIFRKNIFAPWRIFIKDRILFTLLISGILTLGFISFPNGINYKEGLLFWSSQGYDGTWHVALIEEIKKDLPPKSPIFAGEKLANYHYFGDVVMGEFGRVFPFFSSWDLHFRFFPVMFSFMIIISVFALLSRWQQSKTAGYLGIVFTVFTGSFGYVLIFARGGNLFGGETAFWASQLNTVISNPPHAIALSLLSASFLALYLFEKEGKKYWIVILLLLAGFISGFKVSAGASLLLGLGVATIITFRLNQRSLLRTVMLAAMGLLNFFTFISITKGGSSLLIFEPWWFIRTLIVSKLGWVDLELRRQTYIAESNWKRVLQIELTGFLLYLIGNSGTRILGFITIAGNVIRIRKYYRDFFEVAIFSTMIVAFTIPLLFLQKGVPANIIQFMQYFLLILGFYGAITSYKILTLLKSNILKTAFIAILTLFSIPTVIGNFNEFYGGKNATSIISKAELEALDYLKNNSDLDAVILTMPFNKDLKGVYSKLPVPVFAWYPTPYVSAVSSRRTYLSSEEMLDQTGYPFKERLEKMKKFFNQEDTGWAEQFLKDANINYVYTNKAEITKPIKMKTIELFYENISVQIYKVI